MSVSRKQKAISTVIVLVIISIIVVTVSAVLTNRINSANKNAKSTYVTVDTDCGKVEGKSVEVVTDENKKKSVYTFKNIPYAVPPVNELRWRAPIALSDAKSNCWSGILKYSDKKVICKQGPSYFGSSDWRKSTEDCLVLHVRTPQVITNSKLPVLVWIHGGAMIWSSSDDLGFYPNEQFTASLDIITVSINYRLGLFSFLSLKELWETSTISPSYSNFGIMDQILALKWVKNNIANFGGNSDDVTIFGHSGGGTAVYSLMSSNLSRGLFNKGIAASGASNIHTTYIEANDIYRPFIDHAKCNRNTSKEIKTCLKKLNSDVVVSFTNFTKEMSYNRIFPFQPPPLNLYPLQVLDPVVIQHTPGMIPFGEKIKILITNTAHEFNHSPVTNYAALKVLLKPRIDSFALHLYPSILEKYLNTTENITASLVYATMTTDVLITCSSTDVGQNMSTLSNYDVYRGIITQSPDEDIAFGSMKYAFHGWDAIVLFGVKNFRKPTTNEKKLEDNLRQVYKRFINSDRNFHSTYNGKTLVFSNNTIVKLNHLYHDKQCQIWRENGFLKQAL